MGLKCHVCGVAANVKACGNCHQVSYCSKQCQKDNWKLHKHMCRQSQKTANRTKEMPKCTSFSSSGGKQQFCNWCQDPLDLCLTCPGCDKSVYCTEECRKAHWEWGHATACNSSSNDSSSDDRSAAQNVVGAEHAATASGLAQHSATASGLAKHAATASGLAQHAATAAGLATHASIASGLAQHAATASGLAKHAAIASGLAKHATTASGLAKHAVKEADPAKKTDKQADRTEPADKQADRTEQADKEADRSELDATADLAEQTGRLSSLTVSPNEKDVCRKCQQNNGGRLYKCKKCESISYCSRDCQKSDWKRHKSQCTPIEGYTPRIQLQPKESTVKNLANGSFFNFMENPTAFLPDPGLVYDKDIPPRIPWAEAINIARNKLNLTNIIDSFEQVPPDCIMGFPQKLIRSHTLVARISRYHPYRVRHSIVVKDMDENEFVVMFYIHMDLPSPFFTWNSLQPGNFLVIKDALFHVFMDGGVGFRVNDASTIRVIS